MKEKFPNLVKKIDMQVQEAQRDPVMMDAQRPTARHIIIQMPKVKDKERLLKARKKKLVTRRLPERRGEGENRWKVRGLRSTNRLQNTHGDVKYSIGNRVAKELIHMTHGHEQ